MYRTMYTTSCTVPSFVGYQKSIKLVPPSGQYYPAEALSVMEWQKSLLRYSNP